MKLVLLGTIMSGISFNMEVANNNHDEIIDLMKKALINFCEQHNMWSMRVMCKALPLKIHEAGKDVIYINGE